jgi:predicted transglutaminase-like cysteine proteinase
MADLVSFDCARSAQSIEFQLMLRAAALKGGLEARSGGRERLSPDRWRQLVTTNRFVNHAIAALSDEDQFGVGERWSMPLLNAEETDRRPQGDCEDYALEKRERLLALGWPPHAVSLAVARVPAGTLHTVLIARTDRGDFVLDNLHAQPRSIAELDYQWLSRQLGAELWVWGAARLVGADSPAG